MGRRPGGRVVLLVPDHCVYDDRGKVCRVFRNPKKLVGAVLGRSVASTTAVLFMRCPRGTNSPPDGHTSYFSPPRPSSPEHALPHIDLTSLFDESSQEKVRFVILGDFEILWSENSFFAA